VLEGPCKRTRLAPLGREGREKIETFDAKVSRAEGEGGRKREEGGGRREKVRKERVREQVQGRDDGRARGQVFCVGR